MQCFNWFIVLRGRMLVSFDLLLFASLFVVKSSGKKLSPKDPGSLDLTKKLVYNNLSSIISRGW